MPRRLVVPTGQLQQQLAQRLLSRQLRQRPIRRLALRQHALDDRQGIGDLGHPVMLREQYGLVPQRAGDAQHGPRRGDGPVGIAGLGPIERIEDLRLLRGDREVIRAQMEAESKAFTAALQSAEAKAAFTAFLSKAKA